MGLFSGIGDGDDIIAEEKLQQGREYSGYDRLVAFDTFADQVTAVSGDTYHLFRLLVSNQTPNQINGVDNMREIKIYLDGPTLKEIQDPLNSNIYGYTFNPTLFKNLGVKRKVFIHINTTNPILLGDSEERKIVEENGWEVSYDGMEINL